MIQTIGFIGQGWVGKHYADWYEKYRSFKIVRYSLDDEHRENRGAIARCDAVLIAVPTPTTSRGVDFGVIEQVLKLVGKGKIAVIKSTLLPGTTRRLQRENPGCIVLFSPEFLTEATAAHDVANPDRNIVGYTDERSFRASGEVLSVMPPAPYEAIVTAEEAEMIKYGGNNWFYFKVLYINLLYEWCQKLGIDYEKVKAGLAADRRIGKTHLDPIHKSGRGAGGNCFIKDFEAFRRAYKETADDPKGLAVLDALVQKNLELLRASGKDQRLVEGVYGKGRVKT